MPSVPFMAFQNESDVFEIGGLTVENRLDRISVYGALDITKDKEGLQRALMLKRLIDGAIDEMKRDRYLPDRIDLKTPETLPNPFGQTCS